MPAQRPSDPSAGPVPSEVAERLPGRPGKLSVSSDSHRAAATPQEVKDLERPISGH